MLVKFKPFTSIFDEIDSMINANAVSIPAADYSVRSGRFGAMSMKDSGDQVTIRVELPGVDKSNVALKLNDGALTISAERKEPALGNNEQWIRNEISYGTYERSIRLPYSVEAEKVTAVQENGILSVVLPKHENAKPKQIAIK